MGVKYECESNPKNILNSIKAIGSAFLNIIIKTTSFEFGKGDKIFI